MHTICGLLWPYTTRGQQSSALYKGFSDLERQQATIGEFTDGECGQGRLGPGSR